MTDTIKMFGHTFRPLNEDEHMIFAGAGETGLICEVSDTVSLLFNREEGLLEEHDSDTGLCKQFKYLGEQQMF